MNKFASQKLARPTSLPHSNWVTFICHCLHICEQWKPILLDTTLMTQWCHLVRTVDPVSTLMFTSLHRELAGTNICCPVFVPHITGMLSWWWWGTGCWGMGTGIVLSPGGELPPGLETERVSVKQSPVLIPSASADVADIWKTLKLLFSSSSKSSFSLLSWQRNVHNMLSNDSCWVTAELT